MLEIDPISQSREDWAELDRLGEEICELAAHIAAASYRWLVKLEEFDRLRGWAHWGCQSCAHWLSWRCGLDLRSAREKVRVAHALAWLPLVSEAFSRGEISYSKVRAITRIATAETEEELLMFARHGTTQHVEKIVRGYRRSMPTEDANRAHDERYLHVDYDYDDGSVVIRARLTAEEGELVIKALEKARDEAREVRRAAETREDGSAEPRLDRVDGLVAMARRELGGEKTKQSSADRYTVMVHVDAAVIAGGDGACHIEGGSAISAETLRRLTCDGSLVALIEDADGNVLSVGRKTRTIPAAIKRALRERDGGCRFPGCPYRAFVDGHHIEPWSEGGETSLQNLMLLCPFHHRQVHEGKVRLGAEPDGRFTFFLEDGRIIETAPLSVEPGGVESQNRELGLAIDATTSVPKWGGERCDYSVAVGGLLTRNGLHEYGSAEPLSVISVPDLPPVAEPAHEDLAV